MLPDLAAIEAAAETVHAVMPPTPAHRWPLLAARTGAEVWVKHENHTPIGAFKLRGGLVYMDRLRRENPDVRGVIAATRGNFGQSVAVAARMNGLEAVVVVPRSNSREKNAAMEAQGAELVVHGGDFQESLEYAHGIADARGLHMVPSFAEPLVHGTATYALELFRAAADLDAVYVPIGLGSGICGVIAARDALGLRTEIVGVCAERAAAYALSFEAGRPVSTNSADTMADGMACRVPDPDAVAIGRGRHRERGRGAGGRGRRGRDRRRDARLLHRHPQHRRRRRRRAARRADAGAGDDAGQEGRADPLRRQHRPEGLSQGAGRRVSASGGSNRRPPQSGMTISVSITSESQTAVRSA